MFTLAPFAGPAIGPTISGFMSVAGVSWRWVFWLLTLFAGACLAIIVFTIPETYVPILLVRRAEKLRKETGETRYWAPLERNKATVSQRVKRMVARPFIILAREPMLIAITAYMSVRPFCSVSIIPRTFRVDAFDTVRLRSDLRSLRSFPHRLRRRPPFQ